MRGWIYEFRSKRKRGLWRYWGESYLKGEVMLGEDGGLELF